MNRMSLHFLLGIAVLTLLTDTVSSQPLPAESGVRGETRTHAAVGRSNLQDGDGGGGVMDRVTLRRVPQRYPTIQAGIGAALAGDTVLVDDGTYFENINFRGKAITVASEFILDGDTSHIATTVIDGSRPLDADSGSVVYFTSGEDTSSVLCGLTVTRGSGTVDLSGRGRIGGGVLCLSGMTIRNNRILGNRIEGSGQALGGGVFAGHFGSGSDRIHIDGNTIIENTVEGDSIWGGGIWLSAPGRLVGNRVEGNRLLAGSAWAVGAAIACQAPPSLRYPVMIAENRIRFNRAECPGGVVGSFGGGLDAFYADLTIRDNLFESNTVFNPILEAGPAIRLVLTMNARVESNRFRANRGGGGSLSGAVSVIGGNRAGVFGNHFDGNAGGWGGAVHIQLNDGSRIVGNRMVNNQAAAGGGGVYINESDTWLANNLIARNQGDTGGGIGVQDATRAVGTSPVAQTVLDLQLATCAAASGTVAAQSLRSVFSSGPGPRSAGPRLVNNTIVKNHAVTRGGALAGTASNVILHNSILWGNSAGSDPEISTVGGSLQVNFCTIEGGWATGTGNLDGNPRFADSVDFFLRSGISPAIDAGDSSAAYNDRESDHNPGGPCWPAQGTLRNDMGAYGGPEAVCHDSAMVGIPAPADTRIPARIELAAAYPNPFNPSTTIAFTLPADGEVRVAVFNALGQRIAILVDGRMPAGQHRAVWHAGDAPSGLYFYRLSSRGQAITRKMVLMK